MSRWEPNARERLQQSAMELYTERGFDQTTVAEIAARAGLTERTFFRYFADKREVLFWGSAMLQDFLVERVAGAPAGTPPMDAVTAALEATGPMFEERRDFARQRHALIVGHPELRERELIKLASLASALTEALRGRGTADLIARLTAETGLAVFKVAFEHWVHDPHERELPSHLRDVRTALEAIATGNTMANVRHG
ncbi:TetR family transcriptional regulator [Pendulispora brunnea]|uniref:TetR family transcriptional regulator n=1 Tax=Pendulispora brunnea TaxID=2905690 RepID=A0ABZ2KFF8_9BACT